MPLRKPSDFFSDKDSNSSDFFQGKIDSVDLEKNLKIKEEYERFKNLNFSLDSLKNNVDKVDQLSDAVTSLKEEVSSLVSREELDSAILSQLIFVEKNIEGLQKNVKSANSKTIFEVKSKVKDLSESVDNFFQVDVPNYKKLLKTSEIRVEKKLDDYKTIIEDNFNNIEKNVSLKLEELSNTLSGINEENLEEVYSRVSILSKDVAHLLEKEFPKFNKFFAETELRVNEKVEDLDLKISELSQSYESGVDSLRKIVENFIKIEAPKYKKSTLDFKLESEEKITSLKNEFLKNLNGFSESIQNLEKNYDSTVKEIKEEFLGSNEKIDSLIKKYEGLHKDFKNREIYESEKLESYSDKINSFESHIEKNFEENSILVEEKLSVLNSEIKDKILSLESSISSNEKFIKKQESGIELIKKSLQNFSKTIKEEILNETSSKINKKINYLEEILEKFNDKTILKEESLTLGGKSYTKSNDPLTPLDQNFVTLDQLQQHYRLFINRIQQQLASIGGGGAGFIKDLADVDITGLSDGSLLQYDAPRSTWVIASGGAIGAASTWQSNSVGVHTTKNVGIATTSAKANYALYVNGDTLISGNISVAGTVTYDDVTNVDSIGIVTARTDVQVGRNLSVVGITTLGSSNGIGTVTIGTGQTALYVDGSARIVGVLTVGRSSITLDGTNNTITSGIVTITSSDIKIGDNISLNANSSGINSAPNVLYVAKDGNDLNNGSTIDTAKLTISGAVGIAQSGTIIKVLSGTYIENNPIIVPPFVSIVGDSLKTVTVIPSNSTQDIFHLNKGTYLAHMTFNGHTAPAAAVAFPTTVATNVGGGDWESPYVQNCTSNTTTGTGMRIDGDRAEGLKSMVVDAYTQYNQGGVGIAITNNGYAQLVSVFTICCNEAITAYKGGQCSLTNSNTDFGTYGLVADGVSNLQFSGIVTSTASAAQDQVTVSISTSTRPYQGQVVYFGSLYYSIESITITNGGSGYTSTPTVSISSPTGPNGSTATAFATLNNGSVESITVITSGNQYLTTPSITISAPDSGVTATAQANLSPIYYTINSSTPVTAGITTLTLDENLINSVGVGTTVNFYQVSKITATSHTFEYVGSGNTITTATPARGGVAIQENEIVETNGGKVTFTSTDQAGNFRIGNDIVIDQNTGTISGRAFSRSLFSEITPFILALS